MASRERVEFDVVGRDSGGSKVFRQVGDAAEKASDQVDDLGDSYKGLSHEIEQVEGNVRRLAAEIDRTGNKDLFKDLRKQQAELRKLNRVRGLLPDMGKEGEQAASGWAAGFVARVGPLLARAPLGPHGAAIGAAMAVFLVPALSAAVQGAVVGGVGVGGVVGGVALAARDARVQAAGKQLGQAVMGDLDESAARFVEPTIHGIGIIRSAWTDVADDVDDVFRATSRYVEPLARGVGDFVREIMPGIRDAAEAAGPIIREISEGLPRIGRALGDMFSDFSDNADAGASAVRYLFMVMEEGIRFVGGAINAFAGLYRTVLDVADAGYTMADALWGWIPGIGGRIEEGRAKVAELKGAFDEGGAAGAVAGAKIEGGLIRAGVAADTSAAKIQTWADVVDESTGRAFESEHAAIRMEQAIDDAARAAREGADKGISKHTEAGRKNRLALMGIAEAAKANAKTIREQTGSQELASEATERGRKKFLEVADAMGVSKGAAIAYANKLFGIPPKRDTSAKFHPDNEGVRRWKRTLSGIDRHIFIKAEFDLINNADVAMALRLGRLSRGGPVRGPGPKGVDSQPYLLAPGEHVLSAREVDALGGHRGVEQLRAAARGERTALPALAASVSGSPAGRGGGFDESRLAAAIARAMSSMTLRLDDRTGNYATLLSRGDG